jgi:hypothetical protein
MRCDFDGLVVPKNEQIRYRKTVSKVSNAVKDATKPEYCSICGKQTTKLCYSHTIPQYCLREIAVEGKLYTVASLLGGNLLDSEVGLAKANIFKMICGKCDTDFFKMYETPEELLRKPSQQILGQIAAKTYLRELYKGQQDIGLRDYDGLPNIPMLEALASAKSIDEIENERALKTAIRVGKTGKPENTYHLSLYMVLPYVVPLAFQQQICLFADFEGNLINNLYLSDSRHRMEPLHICIFPSHGCTVLIIFRNEKTKRYRGFERQLKRLPESEQLQAVLKIIFAYSEDVLISKNIPDKVKNDLNLISLTKMNSMYLAFNCDIDEYPNEALRSALRDYAVDNLPNPPHLLSEEYALQQSEVGCR